MRRKELKQYNKRQKLNMPHGKKAANENHKQKERQKKRHETTTFVSYSKMPAKISGNASIFSICSDTTRKDFISFVYSFGAADDDVVITIAAALQSHSILPQHLTIHFFFSLCHKR